MSVMEADAGSRDATAVESTDVVIIGGGPCGLAAAIAMQRAGLRAIVFEKSCVTSSIVGYPYYMTFFSTAEKIAIGGLPFVIATEKPTRRDALAYYRAVVKHFALVVRQYEEVVRVERQASPRFLVHTRTQAGQAHVTAAKAVIVATGYFGTPNLIGVPGEHLPHVTHFFREGHEAFDQDAVVIGGGNSAVEVALDLYRAGARVTMTHFGPTWDRNIKPWVLPDLSGRIADGSIRMIWNARVSSIGPETVVLATGDGELQIPADHVYVMTGFTPRPELLAQLGVSVDPTTGVPAHNPETMETDTPFVFIAGVLASGNDANRIFIENGRHHGELIAESLKARLEAGGWR
jgi:thioredoxin reductase (NADPH)